MFDNAKHNQFLKILHKIGINFNCIWIIVNFYWGQLAKILLRPAPSNSIRIQKGVREGCISFSVFSNVYSEVVFKKALEKNYDGNKINSGTIIDIRYPGDI